MSSRRLFIRRLSMALVIPIPFSSTAEEFTKIPLFISESERYQIANSFAMLDYEPLRDNCLSICGWILTRKEVEAIYHHQYGA